MSFWNNIGGQNTTPMPTHSPQNSGFNIGQFMQFMKEMQGQDPMAYMQRMINEGRFTQEQVNQILPQAENIKKMFGL